MDQCQRSHFRRSLNFIDTLVFLIFVSGFEKGDHFTLTIDFELVVLSHSSVDGVSVALCCASIAAPVPELCSLKVRKYARCNYEKTE